MEFLSYVPEMEYLSCVKKMIMIKIMIKIKIKVLIMMMITITITITITYRQWFIKLSCLEMLPLSRHIFHFISDWLVKDWYAGLKMVQQVRRTSVLGFPLVQGGILFAFQTVNILIKPKTTKVRKEI